MAFSSAAWLTRWVLSFGPQAEVLAPPAYRAHVHGLCARAAQAYDKDAYADSHGC